MLFYQFSGVVELDFDFADYPSVGDKSARDPEVAAAYLRESMLAAGIKLSVADSLPDYLPGDDIPLSGPPHADNWVEVPGHYAAWCYRLASLLSDGVTPAFWELVLEVPDVRESVVCVDIQACAERALAAFADLDCLLS